MAESSRLQSPGDDAIAEDERRTHHRVPASRLTGVKAQLTAGPAVVLKDVSRSGARFQSESRLLPGLTVALKMVTPDGVVAVRGRVVRSRLVRMDSGGMGYEAAVSFADLLPGLADEPKPEPKAAEPKPAAPSAAPQVSAPAVVAAAPPSTPTSTPVSPFAALADEAAPRANGAAQAAAAADEADENVEGADSDDEIPMMLVTASVSHTTAQLQEIFNGNDW
jgi:hypothetical protein